MADLAAAAAVIAGPPPPVEMRLFSVGSNSSLESANSDNSEPMRFRSFSDIDLTRHPPSELILFCSNAYFPGPAILPIDPSERFMVAGKTKGNISLLFDSILFCFVLNSKLKFPFHLINYFKE